MRLSASMYFAAVAALPCTLVALVFLQSPASTLNVPFAVTQFIFTAAIGLYAWISDRQWAARNDLDEARDELASRASELERRLDVVVERVAHLPTADDLHQLETTLSALRADMKTFTRQADRIEDYLRQIHPQGNQTRKS